MEIAIALGAAVAGLIVGYFIRKVQISNQVNSIEARVSRALDEAKSKEKEILLEAKSKAMEIVEQGKKTEEEFRNKIISVEERLTKKESDLERKVNDAEKLKEGLNASKTEIEKTKDEMRQLKQKQLEQLQKISGLNNEEAKKVLLDATEKSMKDELALLTHKLLNAARDDADKKAREIVSMAIQRCASEVTSEQTTTAVTLPSEEMKGRIIGKEGRNIRTFEQMLGVEVIVDDTPDAVIISGFNSVRRHIAKIALEKLIQDGRIHPAKIEEATEKAKKEVSEMIREAGEQAVYELGIANFPPKLVQLVGRLKFRTSYGQNVLKHSVEMAKLAALIAEEVGADVLTVKQGALLHDIGKALDQDMEGTHVEIGKQIAQKFNLPEKIVNAIEAHHGDVEYTSIEAAIVDAADNISGSRPGARRDTYENYVARLEELENLAHGFEGVEKVYAIQAGREIRVFVKPEKVDDWSATKLARDIANKIEQDLKYPGEIRVMVIRETRVIEYAR
ncbi:MAG: ribonuclease Y [Candidatus Doudnabacteria bacterium RIFCSPHIGHO2_02_FULL_42_25]|uniref:Ribonuclease Y n=1 Tax=Candidatus Doudnabacteria bacterium RIFCSPHIGHO2_01_FULL_41_86 TaxID=1817821 RepID=A0A1F5N7P2_9BACT|nr:MAG: ribonuclease Y [Candidatus Doudnabacteria bacterium RIFCSPHIGHO2_01_FULL_41_86]OGE74964.1 MAG: ribonuclease Y [Candidatus Doudnabacteria bacterium RIFCSPHIGHO2_01_43_10]OGE85619.1 MAG: ribonuclease Y [Candidatus Doudnabacteria bacterium RIFCSPHIGHO2_12_FULL_42_22]OGE86556.1 MAG: ribonuclease Y [Candidatus Doudnabacteria bacterium RIFCSPHIGHO2_02_FULL_42_25]OGE91973.1 MAG: ribonuclease Y [Candidatus Doudnabacteria bacterium RIFCSPLOWO2_01_FULL_42_60]OGE98288.1 MAG: ribonuclease Y [Candi